MRAVTQADADEVAKLDAILFPDNCFNERTLAKEIALGFGWVIYNGMDLVGYALIRDEPHVLDVIRLGIHPDFQRQHLGTALIKKVLEKRQDVMLTVRESNVVALRMYRRHGFELIGRLQSGEGWVMLAKANAASW